MWKVFPVSSLGMLLGLVVLCGGMVGCKEAKCLEDSECKTGTYCQVLKGLCLTDCQTDNDCKQNETCDTGRGRCEAKGKTCLTRRNKACVGDQLYWMDSCNNLEELVEDCGRRGCLDGKCKESTQLCGNGVCDIGQEDCQSCATDCACAQGEVCESGACKTADSCGDGKCEANTEDCSSCPKDCLCQSGQICKSGKCEEQKSCGNGTCEASAGENCLSCAHDCGCPKGEACVGSGACEKACGNNTCEANLGEDCSTCAQDCRCQAGQQCTSGRCENLCGNGKCDSSYGENCQTCTADCACAQGQKCNNGLCGDDCGNGTCDTTKGENCSSCAKDCACSGDKVCVSGKCEDRCGNGTCDTAQGENCSTCAKDCTCPSGQVCQGGQCQLTCGDGTCDASKGEDCSTCAADCACKGGKKCVQGKCSCAPSCAGKSCGDDGCGGSCGTCSGRTTCTQGQCVCSHACQQGEANCLDSKTAERCELDADGCRVMRKTSCFGASTCKNGSCCSSACTGLQCGPDGCGGSCGTCPARAKCQSGKCVCQNECSKAGDTKCDGGTTYRECLKDASGCLYWSTPRTCAAGTQCKNDQCCKPLCTGRECGSDGCGGSCGTCSYGCVSNLCRRQVLTVSVYIHCDLCDDKPALWGADPDPYVKITLKDGTNYRSKEKDNTCNKTLTFNWTISNLDPNQLTSAKIEVLDEDPVNSDDVCVSWTADLSSPGTKTLVNTSKKNAKIIIEVKK